MDNVLHIGDKTSDDSLIVLDEDRLCYRVRSVSNGAVGVRTISKVLLEEWVDAYRRNPNAPSQLIREQLVGKSEIDKFEYGYAGTLAKMAKMALGYIPVIHAMPVKDIADELPPNVDRLSVALKLFAEKRKDDGEGGWFDTGFDVNANIREYFDALTTPNL